MKEMPKKIESKLLKIQKKYSEIMKIREEIEILMANNKIDIDEFIDDCSELYCLLEGEDIFLENDMNKVKKAFLNYKYNNK